MRPQVPLEADLEPHALGIATTPVPPQDEPTPTGVDHAQVVVVARTPADPVAVLLDGTGRGQAGADGREALPARRVGLPAATVAPADGLTRRGERARVAAPRADRRVAPAWGLELTAAVDAPPD